MQEGRSQGNLVWKKGYTASATGNGEERLCYDAVQFKRSYTMLFLLAAYLTYIYKHQSIASCTCYSVVLFLQFLTILFLKSTLFIQKGGSTTVL